MNNCDRATDFSIKYLRIIEERLHFRWNEKGESVCILSELNTFSLQRLKNELHDLFSDSLRDAAILDSRAYGKREVQTVGFGLVPNFDEFVKIGFLCGSRLILWDFLATRMLSVIDDSAHLKTNVALIASNLLRLNPIVEDGGLVILPHPSYWSDKARHHLNALPNASRVSTAYFGLVSTLSVLEEIPMHPYTVFPGESIDWPAHPQGPQGLENHVYFSKEHYIFHKGLYNLFEDRRFKFLKGVKSPEFYRIVKKENTFRRELSELLHPPQGSVSPQELEKHSEFAKSKLAGLLEKRNERIVSAIAGKTGASLGVIAAIGTLLNAATLSTGAAAAGVGVAILGLSSALFRYLSNYFKNETESVLVQAFYDLQHSPRDIESDESECNS